MQSKTILTVVALAALIFSGVVSAQEPAERPISEAAKPVIRCPVPMQISLTAPPPGVATPLAADFPLPPSPPSGVEPNFGGTQINRHFRHTFTWKPTTKCCQYLQGTLTLTYKALSGGQTATSPNAGNDKWYIFKSATVMASGPLYASFPFPAGQTGTKTIPLTPAMLAGDRLSFMVQDDTSITSAKLDVAACCVRN